MEAYKPCTAMTLIMQHMKQQQRPTCPTLAAFHSAAAAALAACAAAPAKGATHSSDQLNASDRQLLMQCALLYPFIHAAD
jgi:hypothetical protein